MPRLVLVTTCGLPGTGKSTLARRLAVDLSARYLATAPLKHALVPVFCLADCLREDLRDIAYRQAMRLAEDALQAGENVVLDGSFHRRHRRDWAAYVAGRRKATWVNLSCVCSDRAAIYRRLEARQGHEADPWQHASSFSVYEALELDFEPPREDEADAMIEVDSGAGSLVWAKSPADDALRDALDRSLRSALRLAALPA